MPVQLGGEDTPGPNGEKPRSIWRSDDKQSLECPFCGREELSDDRLGFHLVRDHRREIEHAMKRVRGMSRIRKTVDELLIAGRVISSRTWVDRVLSIASLTDSTFHLKSLDTL